MTYEEKIQAAKDAIAEFNSKVPEEKRIDTEKFVSALVEAGGTDDEAIKSCSYEDLEEFGLPKLLARKVAAIFRGKQDDQTAPKRFVPLHRLQQMDVGEVLKLYDPKEPGNIVGQELIKRSGGKRCLIFNPDGSVNVELSAKLFGEIRDNYPERETYSIDGIPQKVYKIGERPDLVADENPLYPGRKLFPDGTCDQTNRNWSGVSYPIRAILYLAVKSGELVIDHQRANDALDLALSEGAEKKIRARFPQASIKYGELEKIGDLPSLKLMINGADGSVGGGRQDDPFNVVKHREF